MPNIDTWDEIADRYDRQFRKLAILCEQQNHRCCYCGVTLVYPIVDRKFRADDASIEHVVAHSLGGLRLYQNEVAACRNCNMMRSSDIEAEEFYYWRIEQPQMSIKKLRKAVGRYRREQAELRNCRLDQPVEPANPIMTGRWSKPNIAGWIWWSLGWLRGLLRLRLEPARKTRLRDIVV